MIDVIIDSNGTISKIEQAIDECRKDKPGSAGDGRVVTSRAARPIRFWPASI